MTTFNLPNQRKRNFLRSFLSGLILLLLLALTGPGVALAIAATDRLYSPTEVPQGLSAAAWAEIVSQIRQGHYQVGPVEGGYQAPNPGQQWQASFDGAGFRIRPDAGRWDWGLANATPDEVVVTVTNQAPVANAGSDQNVTVGGLVTLNGSASNDPDNDLPLSYHWTQTGGPAVTLSSAIVVSSTFTAPSSTAVLTFTLTVTDSFGLVDPSPDEVVVTISTLNLYLPLIFKDF